MTTSWATIKADEIIDFNPRETIKRGAIAKKIAMEHLQPFTRDVSGYELAEFKSGTKFRNGDTLMARITPCLENGKTVKVSILDEGEIAYGSTEYIVMRAKKGISDENYVYYLSLSSVLRDVAIKSMVGSSGRQRVQLDVLKNTELLVPPLEQQREIGLMLKALDDKIENNKKINKHLEEMAQAIFKSWFVDFEPWGGVMPEDWREGMLSDLGDVIGGGTPSKAKTEYYTENGIAWITPKDLSVNKNKFISGGAHDITELGLRSSSAKLMPKGTVLFSSRAPIGYIAIAGNEICTNQGFKSIVPKESVGTAFVYCFLKENIKVIESMASGSTFKEVSNSVMKNIYALVPDKPTLCNFQEKCQPIFEKQNLLEIENAKLINLRDTILPKLMSSELNTIDSGVGNGE